MAAATLFTEAIDILINKCNVVLNSIDDLRGDTGQDNEDELIEETENGQTIGDQGIDMEDEPQEKKSKKKGKTKGKKL